MVARNGGGRDAYEEAVGAEHYEELIDAVRDGVADAADATGALLMLARNARPGAFDSLEFQNSVVWIAKRLHGDLHALLKTL